MCLRHGFIERVTWSHPLNGTDLDQREPFFFEENGSFYP